MGHLSHISWNDRAQALAALHCLPSVDDLEDLLEELDGLAIRDQGLPTGKAASRHRKEVADIARKIKSEAQAIMDGAGRLRAALDEFSTTISVEREDGLRVWPANILHQVFDISPIKSTALDLPPELAVLGALNSSKRELLTGCSLVFELAKLPVRNRIRPGPVPDGVRVRAILACRSYWESLGRSWDRDELSEPGYRDEGACARREDVKGPAVQFLIDALTASEIEFTLTELHSAWVDAEGSIYAETREDVTLPTGRK